MRKILAFLLVLAAIPAFAQFPAFQQYAANNIGFSALGKTSWLAATTSTGNVALASSYPQVQAYNAASVAAFINCGVGNTTAASLGTAGASTTDYPVAPGSVVVISVPPGTTYCAAILPSSTGAVYFTPGIGL